MLVILVPEHCCNAILQWVKGKWDPKHHLDTQSSFETIEFRPVRLCETLLLVTQNPKKKYNKKGFVDANQLRV